jgi:hypothetical protein
MLVVGISDTNRRRIALRLLNLQTNQKDIVDEENCPVKKIYVGSMSSIISGNDL